MREIISNFVPLQTKIKQEIHKNLKLSFSLLYDIQRPSFKQRQTKLTLILFQNKLHHTISEQAHAGYRTPAKPNRVHMRLYVTVLVQIEYMNVS